MNHENLIRTQYFLRRGIKVALDILLHPLVICPVLTAILLGNRLSIFVLLLGLVGPVVMGLLLLWTKKISSFWSAHSVHDRQLLLLVNIIFYGTLLALFHLAQVPISLKLLPIIQTLFMVLSLPLLLTSRFHVNGHFVALAAFISYGTAISIHTSISAITPILLFTVLFGIKGALWIDMHQSTGREIALSALLGMCSTTAVFIFYGI